MARGATPSVRAASCGEVSCVQREHRGEGRFGRKETHGALKKTSTVDSKPTAGAASDAAIANAATAYVPCLTMFLVQTGRECVGVGAGGLALLGLPQADDAGMRMGEGTRCGACGVAGVTSSPPGAEGRGMKLSTRAEA